MFLFRHIFGHSWQKDGFNLGIQFLNWSESRNQRKRIVRLPLLITFAVDQEIDYPFFCNMVFIFICLNLYKNCCAPIYSASIQLAIELRFLLLKQ
jgi:hypothetical protein